jgi:hypothetical protein
MKTKLILGIAGIVVLDLAFIFALTTGVDDPTELAAVAPQSAISRQLPQISQMPVADSAPVEEADIVADVKPVRHSALSKDHSTKLPVQTKAAFDNPPAETATPNFKDTIIFYQGPERESRNDTSVAVIPVKPQSGEPVRKKKNVLVRAFSITKKPYDWVRSLASKL